MVGRAEPLRAMRANPLYRALRVDKMTLAAIDVVLAIHEAGRAETDLPTLRMLDDDGGRGPRAGGRPRRAPPGGRARAHGQHRRRRLRGRRGRGPHRRDPDRSPAHRAPLRAARSAWWRTCARGDPAVVARVADGALVVDLRTVSPEEEEALAAALLRVAARPRLTGAPLPPPAGWWHHRRAMTKTRRLALVAGLAVLSLTPSAFAEEVTRRVGRLTVSVDEAAAYPGGMITVRLRSKRPLGVVYAILEGRRCPFLLTRRGMRALVPVPVEARPGPTAAGHRSARARRPPAVRVPGHGGGPVVPAAGGRPARGQEGDVVDAAGRARRPPRPALPAHGFHEAGMARSLPPAGGDAARAELRLRADLRRGAAGGRQDRRDLGRIPPRPRLPRARRHRGLVTGGRHRALRRPAAADGRDGDGRPRAGRGERLLPPRLHAAAQRRLGRRRRSSRQGRGDRHRCCPASALGCVRQRRRGRSPSDRAFAD